MSEEQTSKPLPQVDDSSRPFFEGAKKGVLMIQRCTSCDTYQSPGRFACDECLSGELEWVEASGRGTVFSFVVMHQKYHPAFEVPYSVTLVELEEGPRLVSNVVGADLQIGMPLAVEFESVREEISLPRFGVTEEAGDRH